MSLDNPMLTTSSMQYTEETTNTPMVSNNNNKIQEPSTQENSIVA